jgi:hypothetical protein
VILQDLGDPTSRAVADGWTVLLRGLAHRMREPSALLLNLFFPALMMLMFATAAACRDLFGNPVRRYQRLDR